MEADKVSSIQFASRRRRAVVISVLTMALLVSLALSKIPAQQVPVAPAAPLQARELYRVAEERGGYSRLGSRPRCCLRELGLQPANDDEVDHTSPPRLRRTGR